MIPTAPEVVREAIIVMAGALLAVLVVKMLPEQWREYFSLQKGDL